MNVDESKVEAYFALSSDSRGVFAIVRQRNDITSTKKALKKAIIDEYDYEGLTFDLFEEDITYHNIALIEIEYSIDNDNYTDTVALTDPWVY